MKHRQDQEQEILDSPMDQTGIRDRAKEFIGTVLAGTSSKIALVSPDHIPHIWDSVHRHLELMTPHSEGELEPEDFYELLTNAEMQLWIAVDNGELIASMVTQVIPYPRKQVLRIISIGGKSMDKWMQFLPIIEDWALTVGCTSLEAWGRKGWLKILKDWKCSYHVITKDLTKRMH